MATHPRRTHMSTATAVHDVFLSFSSRDSGIADIIVQRLSESGLSVFAFEPRESHLKSSDPIREAITECSVVVLIVTPTTLRSSWQAIAIGAAMAWEKPVFVVLEGVSGQQVPSYLRRFPLIPASKLTELVRTVQQELEAEPQFTEEDRELLRKLYVETGEPTDQLAIEPTTMASLTRKFNRTRRRRLAPDRVLQELFRLRKRRELPSLRGNRAH